jgi:hypothetical protein
VSEEPEAFIFVIKFHLENGGSRFTWDAGYEVVMLVNILRTLRVSVLKLYRTGCNKLPEDGTLVPKHVEVGTRYEVCFVDLYITIF